MLQCSQLLLAPMCTSQRTELLGVNISMCIVEVECIVMVKEKRSHFIYIEFHERPIYYLILQVNYVYTLMNVRRKYKLLKIFNKSKAFNSVTCFCSNVDASPKADTQ